MPPDEFVFDYEKAHTDGFELYEGTALDVRMVVAGIPKDVKDGFRVDDMAWHRFGHAYGPATDVPERLRQLRSPDVPTAELALRLLWGSVAHQGTIGSAAPLTVPFLLRVAADCSAHGRADTLGLAAAVARRAHWGFGTRDTFLQVTDEELRWDCAGYAMHWSIEASRLAVSADADLLLGLLHDADPEVRAATGYTLATASGDACRIADALRDRLGAEQAPPVRASLVLAVAELGREHRLDGTEAWTHSLWADPAQPADVRVSAALAWLCLVPDPVPDGLQETFEVLATDTVPWIETRR